MSTAVENKLSEHFKYFIKEPKKSSMVTGIIREDAFTRIASDAKVQMLKGRQKLLYLPRQSVKFVIGYWVGGGCRPNSR